MPNIILNGSRRWVDSAALTYEEIVTLAGSPGQMLTVIHFVPKTGKTGSVVKGQTLLLQEDHHISAADTSAA